MHRVMGAPTTRRVRDSFRPPQGLTFPATKPGQSPRLPLPSRPPGYYRLTMDTPHPRALRRHQQWGGRPTQLLERRAQYGRRGGCCVPWPSW